MENILKTEKIPDNFILTFKSNHSKNGFLKLLIDTGARVSVLKSNCLRKNINIVASNKIKVTGIGTNNLTTNGIAIIHLNLCKWITNTVSKLFRTNY